MAGKDRQRNAYQLTINNPKEHGFSHEQIKEILAKNFPTLEYFCLADEISTTGTYHTHLYVYTTSRVRWGKHQKYFSGAHIEDAAGSPTQNREYIRKSGKWEGSDKADTSIEGTFYEWGELPISQGKDPLMRQMYKLVEDGYSNGEIVAMNSDFIPYIDTIDRLRKMLLIEKYKGTRKLDMRVHYIYGKSGTGKTRYVLDKHGDSNVYRVTDYEHPYDSYNSQSVICYDEFRSGLKISHMLDALDIYPLELPARYSNRCACYTTVYIVSNWALEDQYTEVQSSHPTTWQAFLRRIHTVTYFGEDGIEHYDSVEKYFKHRTLKTSSNPIIISADEFRKIIESENKKSE